MEDSLPDIKPFGYITIPEVKSESVTQVDVEQDVQITDMDQFVAYNKLVINSEEFRLGLRGRPSVKLSGLPSFDVDYNKVVTMKGELNTRTESMHFTGKKKKKHERLIT